MDKKMIFCSKCGEPLIENPEVCSKCGELTGLRQDTHQEIMEKVILHSSPSHVSSKIKENARELRKGAVFLSLSLLSIIACVGSIVQLIIYLLQDLGFNWMLLLTAIVNLISGIAWYLIWTKFDETGNLIINLINLSKKD